MEKINSVPKPNTKSVEKTVVSLFQVGVDKDKGKGYTKSTTIDIVSCIDATVKITGTVTGQQYVFAKAGTVLAVDIQDADELLNKKKGRACCGGNSGTHIFQRA